MDQTILSHMHHQHSMKSLHKCPLVTMMVTTYVLVTMMVTTYVWVTTYLCVGMLLLCWKVKEREKKSKTRSRSPKGIHKTAVQGHPDRSKEEHERVEMTHTSMS